MVVLGLDCPMGDGFRPRDSVCVLRRSELARCLALTMICTLAGLLRWFGAGVEKVGSAQSRPVDQSRSQALQLAPPTWSGDGKASKQRNRDLRTISSDPLGQDGSSFYRTQLGASRSALFACVVVDSVRLGGELAAARKNRVNPVHIHGVLSG